MLPENKQNEQTFDQTLKKALKCHQELPRQEFSEKLIAKIRTIEQQNILRKIVWQERLLLAGFILFPAAAITIIFAYPAVVFEPVRLLAELIPLINMGVGKFVEQWRLWACYAAAAAAAIYAAYDMLPTDN